MSLFRYTKNRRKYKSWSSISGKKLLEKIQKYPCRASIEIEKRILPKERKKIEQKMILRIDEEQLRELRVFFNHYYLSLNKFIVSVSQAISKKNTDNKQRTKVIKHLLLILFYLSGRSKSSNIAKDLMKFRTDFRNLSQKKKKYERKVNSKYRTVQTNNNEEIDKQLKENLTPSISWTEDDISEIFNKFKKTISIGARKK